MENKLEIRQSVIAVAGGIISIFIFEIVWGGTSISFLVDLIKNEAGQYNDGYWACILVLCIAWIIFILLIIALAYIIYCYRKEIDIYTDDRMYHTRGNKIIYELEYKDVIAVREWLMDTLILFCEKPIIKKNGKIGPKTVWANYRKADRIRIMQIISKNYPNINIMSYSNIHFDEN